MAWTTEAWLREALAALRRTLDVDARTKNEMVQFLLDEGFWDKEKISSWESAIAKFNSCLNPNKSEFFKVGELWALAKRFGRHDLFLAMAADLGYEVRRVPTAERQQQLLEDLVQLQAQHVEHVERINSLMAQLQAAPSTAASPPMIPGQRPQFSQDWHGAADHSVVAREGCP
ncbi:hypothetical protein D3C71_1117230 [compost metagenome]